MLGQLKIESLVRPTLTARVEALDYDLRARYGARLDASNGKTLEPGLNLCFETPLGRLKFFTVQGVFKLPQDVAPAAVRSGLWYPDDPQTQCIMRTHLRRDPVN